MLLTLCIESKPNVYKPCSASLYQCLNYTIRIKTIEQNCIVSAWQIPLAPFLVFLLHTYISFQEYKKERKQCFTCFA